MYLTLLEGSMGCVLRQPDKNGRKGHTFYYLSKNFTNCETKYSILKKPCCAFAWASICLRQYMLTYTNGLISKMDPINYIFEKPALTERIARWLMSLSEFDIQYVTQKAIKGKVLSEYFAHHQLKIIIPCNLNSLMKTSWSWMTKKS